MGLQDRSYYQDSYSSPWGERPFSDGARSVIAVLIFINVAIFLADIFSPLMKEGGKVRWLSYMMSMKPAEILSAPWQIWQFLTYGFAHASIDSKDKFFHVGGNMLVLFMLGRPIEQRLGRDEFIRFYVIALLASGAAFFMWCVATQSSERIVGASGAVSAVVALFVFCYPNSTLMLFGVFPLKTWILGVIVVAIDLLRSMDPESEIAWQAHLAGFAFGYAYFRWNWSFERIKLDGIKSLFNRQPNLKIHRPSSLEKIRAEGDAILEKINEHGEESLTARERKILKKYSNQLRNERS